MPVGLDLREACHTRSTGKGSQPPIPPNRTPPTPWLPPGCPPQALATMSPGDVAIIFTPDDSHYAIASACIKAGLHVLVAKPLVKTLEHHRQLVKEAGDKGVMVGVWRGGGEG